MPLDNETESTIESVFESNPNILTTTRKIQTTNDEKNQEEYNQSTGVLSV